MGAWRTIFSSLRGSTIRRPLRRAVARLAPDPATTPEPVVQVYGARCQGLLGLLGMHTWIAVKRRGESRFTVYEVVGGRPRLRGPVLAIRRRAPDGTWGGNTPRLLADKRGEGVDALIPRIEAVVRDYPYAGEYVAWPGPNSNTFLAHVARAVPELDVDLPPNAIGKDYLRDRFATTAPSGHGFQLSLFGLLGFLFSRVEGFEINVLGLSWGFDPFSVALRVPFVGRIGVTRSRLRAPRGPHAFVPVAGVACRFPRSACRAAKLAIGLRGEEEVGLGEPVDLVRPDLDRAASPADV